MKALDAGAYGVIVPMVSNRAEAERAVAACRYPPAGIRSTGPESLRHFRRTFRQALRRQISMGTYDPKNPIIVPIRAAGYQSTNAWKQAISAADTALSR